MEDFLLVFDELDDLYSTVGLIWRPVASFIAAVAVFIATGFVFVTMPVVVEVLAIALVSAGLFEMLRQRRLLRVDMNRVDVNNPAAAQGPESR